MEQILTITLWITAVTVGMAQEKIDKSVVASGATNASNGNIILQGTLGQPSIGKLNNGEAIASIGFWEVLNARMTTSIIEVDLSESPMGFLLGQNYPNPADGETRIELHVPGKKDVSIHLMGLDGKRHGIIHKESLVAGTYVIETDVSHLPEGQYLYVLYDQKKIIASKKMMVSHRR